MTEDGCGKTEGGRAEVGGKGFADGGDRLEVGGKDWKQHPQTSSDLPAIALAQARRAGAILSPSCKLYPPACRPYGLEAELEANLMPPNRNEFFHLLTFLPYEP